MVQNRLCLHKTITNKARDTLAVAPLTWVPWVPGNLSIFEPWVWEPIMFGEKGLKFTPYSVEIKQEIGGWEFGTLNQ